MQDTYHLDDLGAMATVRIGDPSEDRRAYVYNLIVNHAQRGQGWGHRLMERVTAAADEENLGLLLHCRPALTSFYERHGFVVSYEEENQLGKMVFMERPRFYEQERCGICHERFRPGQEQAEMYHPSWEDDTENPGSVVCHAECGLAAEMEVA